MQIFIGSDYHVEMSGIHHDTPVADVGIFAGDIGVIRDMAQLGEFYLLMKERYEHLIVIPGNHEFYHGDYDTAHDILYEFCTKHNIHLLSTKLGTDNLVLDGVTFWGDIFWTDCNKQNPVVMADVQDYLNDFRVITNNGGILSTKDICEFNKIARSKINWDADVIITHFAPIVIPHPNFPLNEISYYFCNTGLEEQIIHSDVKLWIYGHTHHSTDFDLADTRIISNCHGFKSRWSISEGSGYDPDLIVEI